MENNINTDNNTRQQEETVQVGQLLRRCLSRWYWFVLSLAVCLALGVLYILRSTPTYNTSADIQIKSNTKGASMPGDIGEFGNMGLFAVKSNVNNELHAFESPDIMSEVVARLRLYMSYTVDGTFHRNVLYGTSLPISADLLDVDENVGAGFTVSENGGPARRDTVLPEQTPGEPRRQERRRHLALYQGRVHPACPGHP